jgi:hypothetical protein
MYAHLSPYTQVEILSIAPMGERMYALQVRQRNRAPIPMIINRDQIFNLAGNLINNSRMRMNYVAKNGDIDGIVIEITKQPPKLQINERGEEILIESEKLRIDYKDGNEQFYEYETFDEFVDNIISYVGDGHGTIKFMNYNNPYSQHGD